MIRGFDMWIESFRQQALYNQWANQKLYDLLARLSGDEQKLRRPIFADSIDGLLHHLIIADGLTMATLTNDMMGFRPKNRLGQEILIESMVQCLYPDFEDLKTARQHLDRQIVEYVETLRDAELVDPLSYFDLKGERHRLLRWQLLTELSCHQLHHRGQLSAVLHGLGQPLGNLDFSTYLRACVKA
jgi:uncharacterized damage-inducible protein DinB